MAKAAEGRNREEDDTMGRAIKQGELGGEGCG